MVLQALLTQPLLVFLTLFVFYIVAKRSNTEMPQASSLTSPGYYQEPTRPQQYFSSKVRGMDNPNGLVGPPGSGPSNIKRAEHVISEYHLFNLKSL